MPRTIVLIGCGHLEPLIRKAGLRAREADYFWGSENVDPEWVGAVVDSSVAGGTGLRVAAQLRKRSIVPVVLCRPEERHRVLSRFLGVVVENGVVESNFQEVLDHCVRQSSALREADPASANGAPTITVGDSMIIAIMPDEHSG